MSPEDAAANAPLYLNWEFWAAVAAFLALLLSQLPPVHTWFKRARLQVEAYDRLHVTHTLGNPNTQIHLILTNRGNRSLRVRRITLTFQRGDDPPWTLTGYNYYQSLESKSAVILTPFNIGPEQEWAHTVGFLVPFSRQEEQRFRQIQSSLRADIRAKRALMGDEVDGLAEADDATLGPALAFFQQKFKWEPGEYAITFKFVTEPASASLEKRYRIILFESDTADLRAYTADYKYGLGVYYYNAERQPGIFPYVTEV